MFKQVTPEMDRSIHFRGYFIKFSFTIFLNCKEIRLLKVDC